MSHRKRKRQKNKDNVDNQMYEFKKLVAQMGMVELKENILDDN